MTDKNKTEAVSASVSQKTATATATETDETACLDAEREARRREQKRRYYHETFQQKKRRIHGTLERAEYEALAKRAKAEDRSPWQQLLAESRAYQAGAYVPSAVVETELQQLNVECRKIGTNLNQMAKHSNRLRRLWSERPVQNELKALLQRLEQSITRLWQAGDKLTASSEEKKKPGAGE